VAVDFGVPAVWLIVELECSCSHFVFTFCYRPSGYSDQVTILGTD
jgi:hypothetical protein